MESLVSLFRSRVFAGDKDLNALLCQSAFELQHGVDRLLDLVSNYENVGEKVQEIDRTEDRGDDIVHRIKDLLSRIYVTRFDHEDISELAEALDDILDLVYAAAVRFDEFKIEQPTESAKRLVELLRNCTTEIGGILCKLDKPRTIDHESLQKIHSWENEADDIQRRAAGDAYGEVKALISSGHWQEAFKSYILADQWHVIYQRLENAIDRCEDVADVIETMITKYG